MPVENASYKVTESSGFELLPADVYECRLSDINRKTIPVTNDEGETVPADFLEFEFTIMGGEYDGKVITDVAREYKTLGPKSKMRAWIEGMTGQSLAGRTDPVDPNKLIGRTCRVNLSRGLNGKGIEKNKITSLLPRKKTAAAPTPAPKPAPASDEDSEGLF